MSLNLNLDRSRDLSDFFVKQNLLDYIEGRLDVETTAQMRRKIEINPPLQKLLESFEKNLLELNRLGEMKISESFFLKVIEPSTKWDLILKKLNLLHWASAPKILAEGLILVSISLFLILILPWNEVIRNISNFDSAGIELLTVSHDANPFKELELPEESPLTQSVEPKMARTSLAPLSNSSSKLGSPSLSERSPILAEIPSKPSSSAVALDSQSQNLSKASAQIKTQTDDLTSKASLAEGFLWRGQLFTQDLKAVTDELVQKLTSMGAQKAGQVNLGWLRGRETYFHFSIDETRLNEVRSLFSERGQFQLNRERHPRVMPQGKIRMIIKVQEEN